MDVPDDWPTVVLTAEELAQMLAEAADYYPPALPTEAEIEDMAKRLGLDGDPFKGD